VVGTNGVVTNQLMVYLTVSPSDLADIVEDRKRIGIYGQIHYRGASQRLCEPKCFWWYLQEPNEAPRFIRAYTKELNDYT
jgi:hypothetical protein